jgi:putative PIN family toxin of toxin-antitoxin system
MKVILDSNIWISFLIGHHTGLIQRILNDTRFDVIICGELLKELHDVCSRSKIRSHVRDEELFDFFRIIYSYARMVDIKEKASFDIRDPKDLYLLSLAESSEATYIVSGDADILDVKQFGKTTMLSLSEFKERFY